LVGGTTTIYSNLVLGDCTRGAVGEVYLEGGTLYVTNATHTAVIDVENGTLTINGGGTVVADVIVITNSCANFVRRVACSLTRPQSSIRMVMPTRMACRTGGSKRTDWILSTPSVTMARSATRMGMATRIGGI